MVQNDEKYEGLNQLVLDRIDKYEQDIINLKNKKLARDNEDYKQGVVYTYMKKTPQENYNSTNLREDNRTNQTPRLTQSHNTSEWTIVDRSRNRHKNNTDRNYYNGGSNNYYHKPREHYHKDNPNPNYISNNGGYHNRYHSREEYNREPRYHTYQDKNMEYNRYESNNRFTTLRDNSPGSHNISHNSRSEYEHGPRYSNHYSNRSVYNNNNNNRSNHKQNGQYQKHTSEHHPYTNRRLNHQNSPSYSNYHSNPTPQYSHSDTRPHHRQDEHPSDTRPGPRLDDLSANQPSTSANFDSFRRASESYDQSFLDRRPTPRLHQPKIAEFLQPIVTNTPNQRGKRAHEDGEIGDENQPSKRVDFRN
ncbi:GATA zinc finger domain-containing protein 14-like [Bombina bombina]|uniref:GATA zinc finger domain-containing protein 14-like n=1 Tax=Bombina bombina TaxID=8345 RepID=UPI00235AA87D|nr:GATA zinc finger domain-containing protein 14-like [Bombina bombina]